MLGLDDLRKAFDVTDVSHLGIGSQELAIVTMAAAQLSECLGLRRHEVPAPRR